MNAYTVYNVKHIWNRIQITVLSGTEKSLEIYKNIKKKNWFNENCNQNYYVSTKKELSLWFSLG